MNIVCQYISVTLYLLQTYPSGKPLFKGQGSVNLRKMAIKNLSNTVPDFPAICEKDSNVYSKNTVTF